MSLVGDLGTDVLRTTRINKGFLGARGLSLERGLMDLNPDEVRIKQEMADACDQVYGILDGTKWHRSALLSFVAADDLTGIVTDSSAPIAEVEAWRERGVEVVDRRAGRAGVARPRARDLRRVRSTRRRLMATMAAVDLGAQSGRVALGRFDGERLAVTEVHRFPNVPVRTRGTLQWDVLRLFGDVAGGPARGGPRRRLARLGRRRFLGGRLRPARPLGPARSGTPCTTATPASPRRCRPSHERCPARELYERTGIQLMPINSIFELAALAAERDPALGGRGRRSS